MKKIFVRRDESVDELILKITNAEEESIVLVVPRESGIGEEESNFDLIKRESEAAGKKIFVESVDEKILALAKYSGMSAIHPLFERDKKIMFSDIVSRDAELAPPPEAHAGKKPRRKKKSDAPRSVEKPMEQSGQGMRLRIEKDKDNFVEQEIEVSEIEERIDILDEGVSSGTLRRKFKLAAIILGLVIFVAGGVLVINRFFGTAQVTIHFKESPWTYEHSFIVDTSVSKTDKNKHVLPGELFIEEQNFVNTARASGIKNVSQKATGVITIYNAFSSAEQLLVASTRFETPSGLIVRLTNQTLIPGAEVKDGKIIPAKIEAAIVADAPGAKYNIGPIPRLTIPGFKGSPKYEGFYGEIIQPTKGGFVGDKPVPTAADIKNANASTTSILKTSLEFKLSNRITQDFIQFDSVRDFKIIKLTANENTDENGKFSIFGEAKISTIGFREADLLGVLNSIAADGVETSILKNLAPFEYSDVKADITGGKLSFIVSASGTLTTDFAPDDFKTKLVGKTVEEARFSISQLPGLSDAKISIWPAWLRHIPTDADRIKFSFE